MNEIIYEIRNFCGRASLYEYACANLAEALYQEYPKAISLLQDKLVERNRSIKRDKAGLIAVACGCPCCDGSLWQDLSETRLLGKEDYHVLLVSPLPGIASNGIEFDFISNKRPRFRPNVMDASGRTLPDGNPIGNDEEYINEFVDGVLRLLR